MRAGTTLPRWALLVAVVAGPVGYMGLRVILGHHAPRALTTPELAVFAGTGMAIGTAVTMLLFAWLFTGGA